MTIQAGNLLTLGYGYGSSANNGNVQTQTITRQNGAASQTWTQAYGYTDGVNRLTCANEVVGTTALACNTGSAGWLQTYQYDAVGNRAVTSSFSMNLSTPTGTGQYSALTNRIVTQSNGTAMPSDAYDAGGNLADVPGIGVFGYDAENRQVTATIGGAKTCYRYDGDGRRVVKVSVATTDCSSGTTVTTYVYDGLGNLAAEYGGVAAGTPVGTQYLTADALGSTRLVTDGSGAVVRCSDYLPFGEDVSNSVPVTSQNGRDGWACFGAAEPDGALKFTSKERDAESGLDYFGVRYFSSAQGRFTSVDPSMLSVTLRNPQAWNRYSYALNNPLRYVDPNGELWTPADGGTYSWVDTCGAGQKCYNSIASVSGNDHALVVYGSKDFGDIQTYFANGSGNINLSEVAGDSHDANFELKSGAQGYLSLKNAAALFNTAETYGEGHPGDSKLFVTDAGTGNGANFAPHTTHGQGRAVDVRYPDGNGKPLQGPTAAADADVARVRTLVDTAKSNGFIQNYSARPKDFDTAFAPGHNTHLHLGTPIQRITPPSK